MAEPAAPDRMLGADHVARYEATNGEVGYGWWNGATCLVLRTKGRRTGEVRKVPLIFRERDDDFVVVASKGGAPRHPGWYRNLVAHPDVEVQVKGDVIPVRARTATGDEHAELWNLMLERWPDYDRYQASTDREIPVVVLERR
jgi:deazaflavin-dependent oxidoreductase (nitroreductase family)